MAERSVPTRVVPIQDMKSPLDEADRLTVIVAFHHQHLGEPPTSAEGRFCYSLKSKEQPYVRRLNDVGDALIPLLAGCWVEKPGYIVVTNMAGRGLLKNPTQKEKEDIEKKVVVIGCADVMPGGLVVGPGRTVAFEFTDPQVLTLRSIAGPTPVHITVFPA